MSATVVSTGPLASPPPSAIASESGDGSPSDAVRRRSSSIINSTTIQRQKNRNGNNNNNNFVGCWGLAFGGLHLLAIYFGVVDPLSAFATGTLTVHSWFAGWLLSYKLYGLDCRYVRFEAALILSALFQLAIGAGAFSRLYYGPLFGHAQDLFQGLSSIFIREEEWIPDRLADWWSESSRSRYTGLAWWVCEFADVAAHQGPFVLMCCLLAKVEGGWARVAAKTTRFWHACMLAGILHRFAWDYSTCRSSFCDGPYRGFLQRIPRGEQFLWHLLPSVALTAGLVACKVGGDAAAVAKVQRDRAAIRAIAAGATPPAATTIATGKGLRRNAK